MNEQGSRAPDAGWFRGVVEQVVAGIVIVQDGHFAYANPRAIEMLGHPALLGASVRELLDEHQIQRHATIVRELMSGERERAYNEYDVVLPSGEPLQCAVSSTRTQWRGEPAVLGVLHDISAQARALTALRDSEERYRSTVDSLEEGLLIFDAEGQLKGANGVAEKILHRSFSELQSHGLAAWHPLDEQGREIAPDDIPVSVTLATGRPLRHTLVGMRLPDGAISWLDVNAEPLRDSATRALTGAVLSLTDVTEARRVERALEVSEGTNRTLMDALGDGVFVAQDHRFAYVNRSLADWLGYTCEEFVGLPFERVLAPEDLALWIERFRARIGNGPEPANTYEVRFLRKDGSRLELELVANRTRYLDAPAVLGVLRDITDRKRAAAELEGHRNRLEELVRERTRELEQAIAARAESEDFAQTMTDHQPTLLAYLDRELRVQFANRSYLNWFGKTREEVIGHDVREAIGTDMMADTADDLAARVLNGEAFGTPSDMRGHDGRLGHFWIHRLPDLRDGEIRGYYFIATDITELRRSERRLQELNAALIRAESFTRGVADHLPARIAYWDESQHCRFANRAYLEWYGKTPAQVLGKTEHEIFGDDLPPAREAHASAALRGERQEFDSVETNAEGREATWHVHYLPDVVGGEVRGFFKLASDITEVKRAQGELQALNDELVLARDRAQEAAQAKSAFIANMSHEIRTPMNVVIGLTHLMQRDPHDPVTSDRLAKVGDAAQHLLDIINDILDLSKIDAGKLALAPVDFSVDALLARSASLVAESARRKGLALSVDRGDLPTALRGDALRLSQVLVNLLSNAVKFTSRGSVAVRCDVVAREGAEWIVRFAVHDTGMGISQEAQERLFSPFEQADGSTTRRFGGTGLGLSIARELAQLMGGGVGVESEPNRGSVFWFTARLQAAQSLEVPEPPPPGQAAAGPSAESRLRQRHAGAHVLIADDNRINQELATELLRLVDLEVDVADNGRIAAEMAEAGDYDLILMDMQMPEMDGLEATRRIRERPALHATPIVAMTASAFGADRDACLAAGMNDHVGKPVNPATLYEALLRWLDESRKTPAATPVTPAPPAPAAERAPVDPLEGIAALDTVRGLSLFAGQRALYLQALRYFVDLYGAGLAGVEKYLRGAPDASREAVGREVHSMGGAAAALGAIELETAAHRIEAMVRSDRGPPAGEAELHAELSALRAGMATLVSELRAALSAVPAAPARQR